MKKIIILILLSAEKPTITLYKTQVTNNNAAHIADGITINKGEKTIFNIIIKNTSNEILNLPTIIDPSCNNDIQNTVSSNLTNQNNEIFEIGETLKYECITKEVLESEVNEIKYI